MEAPKPLTLFAAVRDQIRLRHYSLRTEKTYIDWIRRYIRFCGGRHPRELGANEITTFLTHLAVDLKVSASTQNQALQALLFLYRDVLRADLPWLDQIVRASRPHPAPGDPYPRGGTQRIRPAGRPLAPGRRAALRQWTASRRSP
jgi:hypothetical protein